MACQLYPWIYFEMLKNICLYELVISEDEKNLALAQVVCFIVFT